MTWKKVCAGAWHLAWPLEYTVKTSILPDPNQTFLHGPYGFFKASPNSEGNSPMRKKGLHSGAVCGEKDVKKIRTVRW